MISDDIDNRLKKSDYQQLKNEKYIRICREGPCKVFAFLQMGLKDTFLK